MVRNIIKKIEEHSRDNIQLGIEILPQDRILIVSPHPDDESIGCGGLIAKYGSQCDVLLITDGGTGNPEWSYEKTVQVRELEFINAMKEGNINKYFQLKCLSDQYDKLKKVRINIDLSLYKHIFVPNRQENHAEHIITYNIMMRAIKRQHINANIYEYEVWTPMHKITNYLDITDYIQKKNDLIRNYQCQLKHIDYISAINGLNCYRGMQYHIKYAEAYRLQIGQYKKIETTLYRMLNWNISFLYNIYVVIRKVKKDAGSTPIIRNN